MNTFNWLLLGHIVGDWLLQNDWMAKGKKQGLLTWPGLAHFTIYTVTIIATLWATGACGGSLTFYLGPTALIFSSHWLIDATDIVDRWMQFLRQSKMTMVEIMVDQTLHLLVLALVDYIFLSGVM